jgi:hypothetical protein
MWRVAERFDKLGGIATKLRKKIGMQQSYPATFHIAVLHSPGELAFRTRR